jgi:hypothetical protein
MDMSAAQVDDLGGSAPSREKRSLCSYAASSRRARISRSAAMMPSQT